MGLFCWAAKCLAQTSRFQHLRSNSGLPSVQLAMTAKPGEQVTFHVKGWFSENGDGIASRLGDCGLPTRATWLMHALMNCCSLHVKAAASKRLACMLLAEVCGRFDQVHMVQDHNSAHCAAISALVSPSAQTYLPSQPASQPLLRLCLQACPAAGSTLSSCGCEQISAAVQCMPCVQRMHMLAACKLTALRA